MTSPKILAVGGAHIDRRGQMTSPFIPGASIPGTMREDVGGGAFNAIRSAVRLGARGAMLSLRGGDGAGETVARAIAGWRIEDLSAVFLDRSTPSYTALLNNAGDVVAALADMQLYEIAFAKQLRRAKVRVEVAAADAILCDANVPAIGLEKLTSLAVGKSLFAIAISPAKSVRLAGILPTLTCLYMNSREAAAIAGTDGSAPIADLVETLRRLGLASGVITNGDRPVTAFDASQTIVVTPPPPRRVADVTGAGDALAGAMTVAILHGKPMDVALREGVAAALLTIETPDAVPDLAQSAFSDMLALVPEAVEMPRSKP